jgi:hypothetical protein
MSKAQATELFRQTVLTVMEHVFTASGYELEHNPLKWSAGQYRFKHSFDDGMVGFIEYQLLYFPSSEWASNPLARFRITLTRTDQPDPMLPSSHPRFAQRTLSELVVKDFGVRILPSEDHWWSFRTVQELGQALSVAGHLIVGYGLGWLSGDLVPNQ